jgi:hypothetical protein
MPINTMHIAQTNVIPSKDYPLRPISEACENITNLQRVARMFTTILSIIHCKKELAIFPSPAGMSLTKLSLGGKKLNYSRPGRV